MIQADRPGAEPDDVEQHRRPKQVGRPTEGIDENLDHYSHAQKRERGEAGAEAEHQQDREQMF